MSETIAHSDVHLEKELIHVTNERLNRAFKNSRGFVNRELLSLSDTCQQLRISLLEEGGESGIAEIDKNEAKEYLKEFVSRINRIEESVNTQEVREREYLKIQESRFKFFLKEIIEETEPLKKKEVEKRRKKVNSEENNLHLERLILDYLLRSGCFKTAETYMKSVDDQFTNDSFLLVKVFREYFYLRRLITNRNLSPLLEWCEKHRSKLNDFNHNQFEYLLKTSLFISLVKRWKFGEIISKENEDHSQKNERTKIRPSTLVNFSRKYIRPFYHSFPSDVKKTMSLLCLPVEEVEYAEKKLCSNRLILEEFRHNFFHVNSMYVTSILEIYLHSGIISLKLPGGVDMEDQKNSNPHFPPHPFFDKDLRGLESSVPYSFTTMDHSVLKCRSSGDEISARNPPLVFPNGSVVGRSAARKSIRKSNGLVMDPRTKKVFSYRQLKRGYVVN